jgi:hypothetical protein
MTRAIWVAAVATASSALAASQQGKLDLPCRWVYVSVNLLVDKNVESTLALLERSARDGYTGIVLTDSKFCRWDDLPERYLENVRKVRQACRKLNLACIAAVCPVGYSEGILGREPNLAEGLPVVEAPFVVGAGRIVPDDDSGRIANGGFEQWRENMPAGWQFADQPGKITFIDTQTVREGKAALRMQDISLHDPQHGHGRIYQKLQVKPFRYYHVSAWVKTEDFAAADEVRIQVLVAGGASLNYYTPRIAKTQDWKQVDITFNSLEFPEVNLYLGVWGGTGGKIWWDDVRVQPGGLVNLIRRQGAPFKLVSADGQTTYVEGKDFDGARDPKLGMVPWPGGFSVWHEVPGLTAPDGSRLKEHQRVLTSYYHAAIIHTDQVACCMSEPKTYEILQWQVQRVCRHVQPDGYFMQHDEIRVQGWDESCRKRNLTCGEILADNVRRCVEIIRKEDPGKPIYVWSDMFYPTHNAHKTGRYYLVKGEGPWYGSWKGLPKDVVIVNWNSQKNVRAESLRHFADLGHKQILAGYYDGDPKRIGDWLSDAASVGGVIGVMYTTWRQNYGDLERFAEQLGVPWE